MKPEQTNERPERSEKRITAAVPIRVTYWDQEEKSRLAMACTYDISPRGARMTMLPGIKGVGEIISVEQGRTKALCRVVWIICDHSQRHCHMGIQCIEPETTLWDAELRQMEELYDRMVPEGLLGRMRRAGSLERDRRRYRRFQVEGSADLLRYGVDNSAVQTELRDLSSFGCRVASACPMVAGTDLKLALHLDHYELKMKARVLRVNIQLGLGIEFREIRKGDRQFLDFLMQKLDEEDLAENPRVEAARISM